MREAEATVDSMAKVLEEERAQARKAAQEAAEVPNPPPPPPPSVNPTPHLAVPAA